MTRPAARSVSSAAALLAAGALTLTACGHSADPAAHLTACQIVTKSDLHQVIPDEKFTPPPTNTDTKDVCLYSGDAVSVTVTVTRDSGKDEYTSELKRSRSHYPGQVATIGGIKDQAFRRAEKDGFTSDFVILRGDDMTGVLVRNDGNASRDSERLAEIAISRAHRG